MKYLVFLGILAVATGAPNQEVFKYEDEETKQIHYMSGEPGTDVEGGFQFLSPEGQEYKLTYRANEMGFQPEAKHLPEGPEPVDDTVEVKEAKSNFYSLYKEMEKKLEEVAKEKKMEEPVVDIELDNEGDFNIDLRGADGVPEEEETIVEVRKRRETVDLEDQVATEAKDVIKEVVAVKSEEPEKKMPHHHLQYFKKYQPHYYHPYHYYHHQKYFGMKPDMKEGEEMPEKPVMEEGPEMPATMKDGDKFMPHYYHPYHYYHHQKYFGMKPNMKEGEEMPEMPVMEEEPEMPATQDGDKFMPHYYHPYFHYNQEHHKTAAKAKPEDTETIKEEADAAPVHPGYLVPYRPYYHPYYNPYFFYHYNVHHKKPEMEEMPEKHGSFFPFYFAKPTMEDEEEALEAVVDEAVIEGEEVVHEHPIPCKHLEQILEQGQHFPYPPFYYPPISNFPVVADEEVKADEDVEGGAKAKTVSFPVHYHSYFPKYRYTQYKKPAAVKEKVVEKEGDVAIEGADVAAEEQEETVSRKKRDAQFVIPAHYLPSNVKVIKTTVRLAKPSNAEETGEEVVTSSEEMAKTQIEMESEKAPPMKMEDTTTTQKKQPFVPVYYPHVLPVVTRVHAAAATPLYHPVQVHATYPVQYPAFRYPSYYPAATFVQTPVVAAAAAPASGSDAAPLPEKQFPIFPKPENEQDEQQAALAF